jgi:large subunit ribosomal protein L32
MAVPKRKVSKCKVRARRAAHRRPVAGGKPCPQCGAPHLSHRACPACGYYKGRQVLTVEAD